MKFNSGKTKKSIVGTLVMGVALFALCSAAPVKWTNGTWEGEGKGFLGQVKVSVTVKAHKIKTIKIVSTKDDKEYFSKAEKKLIPAIIAKQSSEVDAVSGATFSSKGIKKAVKEALKKAEK